MQEQQQQKQMGSAYKVLQLSMSPVGISAREATLKLNNLSE
jgi:hypothetical protein